VFGIFNTIGHMTEQKVKVRVRVRVRVRVNHDFRPIGNDVGTDAR